MQLELLSLLFVGWSVTNILVNGSIFDPLRNYLLVKHRFFGKLLDCVTCSGFWVGVLIYFIFLFPSKIFGISPWISCFIWGFANSGVSVLINSVVVFLLENNRGNYE